MHNKSDVSGGHSESDVILITIYQHTNFFFNQFKISKNIKYCHHSIIKKRRKKKSSDFFKRVVYHVWHGIYALLLIPYNDVVEEKALMHNAMNFLSIAIG